MFDDLRKQAFAEPEEEKKPAAAESPAPKPAASARKRKKRKLILGMTGPQRFAVSLLLALMTCVSGFMFLFVMGKIGF